MRLDRADNVPLIFFPLVCSFWLLWTLWLVATHALLHLTCRIEHKFPEGGLPGNYIYCCWHDGIVGYLVGHWKFSRPMVIFINYDWYMPPIHWFAIRMRTKKIVKYLPKEPNVKAADEAVNFLKQGYSQFHLPDGPRGPHRKLKKGILHMSASSGAPVVPIKVETSFAVWFPFSWDKKRVPLPFSKITLTYGLPITVDPGAFEAAEHSILEGLG